MWRRPTSKLAKFARQQQVYESRAFKPIEELKKIAKKKQEKSGLQDTTVETYIETPYDKSKETLSLQEDVFKAYTYTDITRALNNQYKLPDPRSDKISDVMKKAIRDDLRDLSRPVLVNELGDFTNPYMMKKITLERALRGRCVQGFIDTKMVDTYLCKRPDLAKLRLEADMPPEVIEPLMAFRGDIRYSYDARMRLEQKVDTATIVVDQIAKKTELQDVLNILPENRASDEYGYVCILCTFICLDLIRASIGYFQL